MSKKVLVPDQDFYAPFYQAISDAGLEVCREKILQKEGRLVHAQQLGLYDYVFIEGERVNRQVMWDIAHRTRLIIKLGAGLDKVDVEAAREYGITVMNTPGKNSKAVAEHAVALMLSQLRNITGNDRKVRKDGWGYQPTLSLYHKTIGVVGGGNIGKELIKLLKGFDCRFLIYDIHQDAAFAKENHAEYTDMDTLCAQSDVISVHVPLNEHTCHIINKQRIGLMKSTSVLINTSRGGTVDENALIEALDAGRIGGAGLDVFETEPLEPQSKLRGLDNVVLTAHTASSSEHARSEMIKYAVELLLEFDQKEAESRAVN